MSLQEYIINIEHIAKIISQNKIGCGQPFPQTLYRSFVMNNISKWMAYQCKSKQQFDMGSYTQQERSWRGIN
jgi:hypothetical protein